MYRVIDFYKKMNLNTKDDFTSTYVLKSQNQIIEVNEIEYLKMRNRGEVKLVKNRLLEGYK